MHMNRLDMDGGSIRKLDSKTFGFEPILRDIKNELLEFFETPNPFSPFLLTIKGEVGSGKTVFTLNLIEELLKTDLFIYYKTQLGNSPLPILASYINPESDLSFLNMWRPILR